MKKIILSLTFLISNVIYTFAQCPMCKAAVESNLSDGGTTAVGLNTGIIYLFMTPFAIALTIGGAYFWTHYRNRRGERS